MVTNQNIPRETRERVAWVLYQLKLRSITMRQLARSFGISHMTLRGALFQPQYPQEKILADAIGLSIPELFPERYDADGNRLHRIKATAPTSVRHGKKTRAA